MIDYNHAKLRAELERDEGSKKFLYDDATGVSIKAPKGFITGGIGFNFDANGIPDAVINVLYTLKVLECEITLSKNIPWWRDLSDARQRVLMNMCYNMGWCNIDKTHGLCTFKVTLNFIQSGHYEAAAQGMKDSQWAQQVGERAKRLAEMMRNG